MIFYYLLNTSLLIHIQSKDTIIKLSMGAPISHPKPNI